MIKSAIAAGVFCFLVFGGHIQDSNAALFGAIVAYATLYIIFEGIRKAYNEQKGR